MNLKIKNKKIAFSFNDFFNPDFNNFIEDLNINNKLILYTSQITAKKIFSNKVKIKFLKKKKLFFYNLFKFISKTKSSPLQNYYYIEKIINENFLLKFFYILKYIFYKFDLLIDINFLRKHFIREISSKEVFDYLITDFRSNEVYSNHEVINYAKKKNIKIIVIIFSWDNLFSEDVNLCGDYYFVGSDAMRKILHHKHKVPFSKIYKNISFQFLYLLNKVNK